eukprot:COSAG05_NODE_1027_length_6117_cov_7.351778_4_plen_333_part_00
MDADEVSIELTFHGAAFVMSVTTIDESVVITAEEKETGDRWRGQFSSRYIEEITHKTGNYKKFAVFVKMLTSALTTESDSVFIDLLTYADLELLKSRKTGKAAPAPSASASKNNKRYLIMTYAVEFDRVHYPLPLNFEDAPDPNLLKQTITRLRQELAEAKRGGGGYRDDDGGAPSSGSDNALRAQLEKERRAREQAESAVASGRRQHSRRLHELERVNEDLRAELEHTQTILREGERQASRADAPGTLYYTTLYHTTPGISYRSAPARSAWELTSCVLWYVRTGGRSGRRSTEEAGGEGGGAGGADGRAQASRRAGAGQHPSCRLHCTRLY